MTGRTVRRMRHALGLTQEGFAKRLGVTGNTVARWERDEMRVGTTAARLIQTTAAPIRVTRQTGSALGRPPTGDVELGKQFREIVQDFQFLLRFANHSYPQRPWADLFRVATMEPEDGLGRRPTNAELQQWCHIDGEPFSDAAAEKLQRWVRQVLDNLINERTTISAGPISITFHWHPQAGLHANVNWGGDRRQLYEWHIFELIRQGKHRLLARCAECGNFWLRSRRSGKYCGQGRRCRRRRLGSRPQLQTE